MKTLRPRDVRILVPREASKLGDAANSSERANLGEVETKVELRLLSQPHYASPAPFLENNKDQVSELNTQRWRA